MIHTVLIVDDYEPWRRHVASTLRSSSRWRLIGEATDGAEAIEKALVHRPDLILLDVGLPTLNGIEAARRILTLDANLRIIFVSEHHSLDIVETALCTGARGYVCKSDAGHELPHAMDAIAHGRRFVGARLGGRVLAKKPRDGATRHRHEVAFYTDEVRLLDDWAQRAEAAFHAGDAFIVLASDSCREKLRDILRARGMDVDRAAGNGSYVALDVSESLSRVMVDGWPDEARFWEATFPLLLATANATTRRRMIACGECAPTLCALGKPDAAIRLEQLWDDAARTFDLDIFCGYPSKLTVQSGGNDVFERLCALHTAVDSR